MTANSVVSGRFQPKFKLTQAFIFILVTRKNEEDQIKNVIPGVIKTLCIYILDVEGQLTP